MAKKKTSKEIAELKKLGRGSRKLNSKSTKTKDTVASRRLEDDTLNPGDRSYVIFGVAEVDTSIPNQLKFKTSARSQKFLGTPASLDKFGFYAYLRAGDKIYESLDILPPDPDSISADLEIIFEIGSSVGDIIINDLELVVTYVTPKKLTVN